MKRARAGAPLPFALFAVVALAGCARTPPGPAPNVTKGSLCEKTPPTHQLVEIRGTKDTIIKVLKLGVLEETPDHGGHREEGDTWITAGSVTDEGLARLRAEACTEAVGCKITIVETKEDYAKRIDELYCPADAASP